jgi:hypothetical protein
MSDVWPDRTLRRQRSGNAPRHIPRPARADLEHLQFLHCLRATGMPIRRMQEVAALAAQGTHL